MFEKMIDLIERHASYGPAMKEAAHRQEQLILDYHTHGRGTGYCISIAKKKHTPLRILGQAEPLVELVHIRGVGEDEAQCDELMGAFGRELASTINCRCRPSSTSTGSRIRPHERP